MKKNMKNKIKERKTKDFHGTTKSDIKLGMNVEDDLLQPFLQKVTK